jgi:hypothetical protein
MQFAFENQKRRGNSDCKSQLATPKRSTAFRHLRCPTGEKTRATAEAGNRKRHFYKPLPAQFRHEGFAYRQITRDGNAAIYEQSCAGCSDPSVCYEVIRIRWREGFEINGRFVEPAEAYPNSEAWGVDGFTLTDKDAAFAKLRQLESASSAVAP